MSDSPGSPRHVSPLVRSYSGQPQSSSSTSSHHVLALDPSRQPEAIARTTSGSASPPPSLTQSSHSEDTFSSSNNPLPGQACESTSPSTDNPPIPSTLPIISPPATVATPTTHDRPSRALVRSGPPLLPQQDDSRSTENRFDQPRADASHLPLRTRGLLGGHGDQDVDASMVPPGPISPQSRRASSVDSIDIDNQTRPFLTATDKPRLTFASDTRLPKTESRLGLGLGRGLNHRSDDSSSPAIADKSRNDRGSQASDRGHAVRRRRSEEQIQAKISSDEPSNFARSRKASHYHGLFRSDTIEKKETKKIRDPAKGNHDSNSQGANDSAFRDSRQQSLQQIAETVSEVRPDFSQNKQRLDGAEDQSTHVVLEELIVESPEAEEQSEAEQQEQEQERDDGGRDQEAGEHSVEWHSVGAPVGAYPIRLLEEIRAFPDVLKSGKEPKDDSKALKSPPLSLAKGGYDSDEEFALPVDSSRDDVEDDDSEKEHISAATYFPHQAPSPDDLDKGRTREEDSFGEGLGEPALPLHDRADKSDRLDKARHSTQSESKRHSRSWSFEIKRDSQASESVDNLSEVTTTLTEPDGRTLTTVVRADNTELADVETTPQATPHFGPIAPRKRSSRAPLGAVELKPYKHQVGGHTKVFSFSKQAICKELNNRENAFYEVIERRHPELLDFMPRYLGVLNVTYTKAKRKARSAEQTIKDEEPPVEDVPKPSLQPPTDSSASETSGQATERVISHSLHANAHEETVARVIYANNMHIIPSNLFPLRPGLIGDGIERPQTAPAEREEISRRRSSRANEGNNEATAKPKAERYPSWGATTVNQKLKEKVLRDVFSPPVIYHRHRRRSIRGAFSPPAANANGDAALQSVEHDSQRLHAEEKINATLTKTVSDLSPLSPRTEHHRGQSVPNQSPAFKEMAQRQKSLKPEIPQEEKKLSERHVTRRRSDQGLQRKQFDVDTDQRTELQYYEEDGYGDIQEDAIFPMDLQEGARDTSAITRDIGTSAVAVTKPTTPSRHSTADAQVSATGPTSTSEILEAELSPELEPPSNPLEAQLQHDERVKHFLLLEDLTSGMKKPCVLDLKMGTRQYGIEANQKKKNSQRLKCKMTTSRQLGVRVCGMQRWDVKAQQPMFEDKYAGRDLHAGREFQDALRRFLYDGVSNTSMIRHIPVLLEKLSRLEKIIQNLPRYRFYASSLLMIYDAAALPSQKNVERGEHPEESRDSDGDDAQGGSSQDARSTIDIKLIDFANCVTSQTKRLAEAPCPPHRPSQPDRGYIRGLRSLRSYLQRIWQAASADDAESWMERGDINQKSSGRGDNPEGWRETGGENGEDDNVSD